MLSIAHSSYDSTVTISIAICILLHSYIAEATLRRFGGADAVEDSDDDDDDNGNANANATTTTTTTNDSTTTTLLLLLLIIIIIITIVITLTLRRFGGADEVEASLALYTSYEQGTRYKNEHCKNECSLHLYRPSAASTYI